MRPSMVVPPPSKIHVAIFGGDGRVHSLRGQWAENCFIETYEATDSQAERLAASCRMGTVTHLIILTRWAGHSQHAKLKASLLDSSRYITWRQGIGSLKEALPRLVGLEQAEAPKQEEDPTPLSVRARSVGLTVACYEEEHDNCPFCGKAKVLCGCYCHQDQTVQLTDETLRDQTLEVVNLDEQVGWTPAEIAGFLSLSTEDAPRLLPIIQGLALDGALDERDGRIYKHKEPEPMIEPVASPSPVAIKEAQYILMEDRNVVYSGFDRELVLAEMCNRPKARLFKEMRTRVKVEIIDE